MHPDTEAVALSLLRRHPGWSDARAARELHERGEDVSARTVGRWRQNAGLAPATENVETYPPPRLQGVYLACGHLVHPEKIDGARGRCGYCGGDIELAAG